MTYMDRIEAAIHEYLGGITVEYLEPEEHITLATDPSSQHSLSDACPRVIVTRREA